jgi:hypothetical protein
MGCYFQNSLFNRSSFLAFFFSFQTDFFINFLPFNPAVLVGAKSSQKSSRFNEFFDLAFCIVFHMNLSKTGPHSIPQIFDTILKYSTKTGSFNPQNFVFTYLDVCSMGCHFQHSLFILIVRHFCAFILSFSLPH